MPLALMAAIGLWRSVRWKSVGYILLIGLVVFVVNGAYYARNVMQFGGPFGPSPAGHISLQVVNTAFTPRILLENLLRDTASMVAGPSHIINEALENSISYVAEKLHLNLQDPRSTQPIPGISKPYDGVAYFPNNEYRSSWPLQMFLIGLLPLCFWLGTGSQHTKMCWLYTLLPIGCLITAAAILRWQQTINHLLIPIPALFMPVAAVVISGKPFRWFRPVVALSAVIALMPFAFLYPRTLLGQQAIEEHSRIDLLVRQHSVNARTLTRLAEFMKRYDGRPIIVGLSGRTDLPPYSIESAIDSELRPRPQFIYFNATIRVPGLRQAAPALVIANAVGHTAVLIRHSTGMVYKQIATVSSLALYAPVGAGHGPSN
jgi:hypothetical protein